MSIEQILKNIPPRLNQTKEPHWSGWVQLKMRARLRGAIEQRRVRTASGSDRIVHATQPEPLFLKSLFDPVATARGSDTTRGDPHFNYSP